MGLSITHNSAAMNAQRRMASTSDALGKSIERLSSGFKINNAGDDPAGLVISEKLRAQIGGLNQAIKNAGDAVNMVKTAEGALTEVNRLLGNIRTLAVHAANAGANDQATTAADQAQIASSLASINKISSETQFGGKKLLDGSAGVIAQVKGTGVVSADLGKSGLTSDLLNIDVNLTAGNGTQLATKATSAAGTVNINTTDLSAASITINGVNISGMANANENNTVQAINNHTAETGVVASVDVAHHLILTQQNYGSSARIDVSNGAAAYGTANYSTVGQDAKAIVSSDGTTTGTLAGGAALWDKGTGLTIKDSLGNAIQLTVAAGTTAANNSDQIDAKVGTMTFQVGAYAGQTRSMNIGSVNSTQLGLANTTTVASLSLIDVTTTQGAQDAMTVIDKAIADVSTLRASLGSAQTNTFESAINSLSVASENISASESTIRDTDMAAEMVNFTKNQIMQQAGVSMLAQANQAPQALLKLLG